MFGTCYHYDEKGNLVGKSRPGLMKGTRVYTDQNGKYIGKSHQGFLVKEVFTDADYNHITSVEGLIGDIHLRSGVPIGHTRPGFGLRQTTLEWEELPEDGEMADDVFCGDDYADDYEDDYEDDTPAASQREVVKNLLLFVLCLVICAVIFCVCAIVQAN